MRQFVELINHTGAMIFTYQISSANDIMSCFTDVSAMLRNAWVFGLSLFFINSKYTEESWNQ